MRLLPRTPRRTWTLAALVWAAGSVALWWLMPLRPRAEWAIGPQREWVGYIPDRRAFVSLPFDVDKAHRGPLRFWEADSGRVVEWFNPDQDVYRVVVSPNGQWIAVYRGRTEPVDTFQVFETATGRVRFDLPHRAGLEGAGPCFSADGRWLACSERTADGDFVHVWDVEAGQVRRTLRAADGLPKFAASGRLAFGPDGRTLAVADDVRESTAEAARIQLWDWDAGRVSRTLVGPASAVRPPNSNPPRLHFSPEGRHLTSGFDIEEPAGDLHVYRPEVRCWDLADGRETLRLPGQIAAVSPGRLWVFTWDRINLQEVLEAWAYSGRRENRVAVASENSVTDGKALVLESPVLQPIRDWLNARGISWPFATDESVHVELLDAATRRIIARLPPRDPSAFSPARNTALSPDGQLLAEAFPTGVCIWDVPPRTPLAWFLAGSALFALLLAGLTRLRLRKVRHHLALQHS